jgi:two-component system, cell cycle sensor histidine kinase and response regulator CckA
MLNLYVNAWQAMPGGGTIYIQTHNMTLGRYQLAPFQYRPGDYVKISVTDTGVGMDETVKQKIFEPFFTTKDPGQGTGLGLSSVYGIVKNHGGYITVYSEPGKGSTFNIYLPATQKPIEEQEKKDSLLPMGDETVLLVDDEPIILEIAQTMLSELGYTVLTADNGETGIDLFERHRKEIDVVILDLIMPKMSGAETFDKIKSIDPAARVLLSSGYSRNGQAENLLKKGCSGFIQKPFNIFELSRKIREVLDESGIPRPQQ